MVSLTATNTSPIQAGSFALYATVMLTAGMGSPLRRTLRPLTVDETLRTPVGSRRWQQSSVESTLALARITSPGGSPGGICVNWSRMRKVAVS